MIEVLAPGPYATVQDLGRPGYAHLGVPHSGAADAASLRLANRLVGNPEGAAGVELTFGGVRLAFHTGAWVAITGAPCPLTTPPALANNPPPKPTPGPRKDGPPDQTRAPRNGEPPERVREDGGSPEPVRGPRDSEPYEPVREPRNGEPAERVPGVAGTGVGSGRVRGVGVGVPFWVPGGTELRFGIPEWGLRTYLAIRGGIAVEPVLGSRSTDSLSGLGPSPLRAGTMLPVGVAGPDQITVDWAPPSGRPDNVLRVVPGPRDDWFAPGTLQELCAEPYETSQDSNRVGVRLLGRELKRARAGELPSEGMVTGAIQVPPSGQPIIFLADHPPTGGYPVIAVLRDAALPTAAQLRPSDRIRFTLS